MFGVTFQQRKQNPENGGVSFLTSRKKIARIGFYTELRKSPQAERDGEKHRGKSSNTGESQNADGQVDSDFSSSQDWRGRTEPAHSTPQPLPAPTDGLKSFCNWSNDSWVGLAAKVTLRVSPPLTT